MIYHERMIFFLDLLKKIKSIKKYSLRIQLKWKLNVISGYMFTREGKSRHHPFIKE